MTKPCLQIAVHEFRSLFYGPFAWLLLILFIIQSSMYFSDRLVHVATQAFAGQDGIYPLTSAVMTNVLFGVNGRLLPLMHLYVPLITMGLIAREINSGSMKLLLSSPIGLGQIVAGKFLAVIAYFALLTAYLAVLTIVLGVFVEGLDYALALTSILGLYLLICSYAAIGVFLSSLTGNQVVAAIGTLAVLSLLQLVGGIGQRIPIVDDIAYWFDLSNRMRYMISGLIASKDVIYYVAIILLFLTLTCLKLSSGRRREFVFLRLARIVGVVGLAAVVGLVSSMPQYSFYLDTTRGKSLTLPLDLQSVMKNITGPWTVTIYVNVLGKNTRSYLPRTWNRRKRSMFDEYVRENGDLSVDYVFYYAPREAENYSALEVEELAREFAEQHRFDFDRFLTREAAEARAGTALDTYLPTYVVSANDRVAAVRTYDDLLHRPFDAEFGAGLRRLVEGGRTIAYVGGQGERSVHQRSVDGHNTFISSIRDRRAMVNHGFDVVRTHLDMPVEEAVDILVLAAPQTPYSDTQLAHLSAYFEAGGNAMVLVDEGSGDSLAPVLKYLGITTAHGISSQPTDRFSAEIVFAKYADAAAPLGFVPPPRLATAPFVISGGYALSPREDSDFSETRLLTVDADGARAEGVLPGRVSAAWALERNRHNRKQRIVVIGDADFLTSSVVNSREYRPNLNYLFLQQTLRWLSHGAFPIDTSQPPPRDVTLSLQLHQIDYFKIVLYGILPLTLLLAGTGLLMGRRQQ